MEFYEKCLDNLMVLKEFPPVNLGCTCVIKSGGFDQNMDNCKFETSGGMLPRKTGCNLILHSRAEYVYAM